MYYISRNRCRLNREIKRHENMNIPDSFAKFTISRNDITRSYTFTTTSFSFFSFFGIIQMQLKNNHDQLINPDTYFHK